MPNLLLKEARADVAGDRLDVSFKQAVLSLKWQAWVLLSVAAALVVGMGLAAKVWLPDASLLEALHPQSSSESLLTMWQIMATLVAIGFSVLALIFELGGSGSENVPSRTGVVLHATHFRFSLVLGVYLTTAAGVLALWGQCDVSVVIVAILLIVLLGTLAITYGICLRLYANPVLLERKATERLLRLTTEGLSEPLAIEKANSNLRHLIDDTGDLSGPFEMLPVEDSGSTAAIIVQAPAQGHVAEVSWLRILEGLGWLRTVVVAPARTTTNEGPSNTIGASQNARLKLHVQVGQRVEAGAAIFSAQTPFALKADQREALDGILRDAVAISSLDEVNLLDYETGRIVDRSVAFLRSGQFTQSADLVRSMLLMAQAGRALIREKVVEEPGIRIPLYSQQLRGIAEGMFLLTEEAARLGRPEIRFLFGEYADWTYSSVRQADLESFLDGLRGQEWLWDRCAEGKLGDPTSYQYVLLRFSNLLTITLPSREAQLKDHQAFSREVALALVRMLRIAIKSGDAIAIQHACDELKTIAEDISGAPIEVRHLLMGGWFAILAWARLPDRRHETPPDLLDGLIDLVKSIPPNSMWPAFRAAKQNIDGGGQWSWWEFDDQPSRSGGILQMSDQVDAVVADAINAHNGVDLPPITTDSEDVGLVRSLERHLGSKPGAALDQLRAWLEQVDRLEDDELRKTPIDAKKSEEFVQALQEDAGVVSPLLQRFEGRDRADILEADWTTIGYNVNVPKSFFVTQDGVYADAKSLAREFVIGITRAEETRIAKVIRGSATHRSAAPDEVANVVAEILREASSSMQIFVNGSWRIRELLNEQVDASQIASIDTTYVELEDETSTRRPWILLAGSDELPLLARRPPPNTEFNWDVERNDLGIRILDRQDEPSQQPAVQVTVLRDIAVSEGSNAMFWIDVEEVEDDL